MDDEQEFIAEAQRVRDEQVASQETHEADPAVQASIDHANETAGTGPEPGSGEPGFLELGGLSKSEIEAQQQEVAERASARGL
jgi:hypothetical protein